MYRKGLSYIDVEPPPTISTSSDPFYINNLTATFSTNYQHLKKHRLSSSSAFLRGENVHDADFIIYDCEWGLSIYSGIELLTTINLPSNLTIPVPQDNYEQDWIEFRTYLNFVCDWEKVYATMEYLSSELEKAKRDINLGLLSPSIEIREWSKKRIKDAVG